ncbi:ornithine cyclodeaminase family protein [Halopenitus salinus]|uniref:Ornithine cyclodeaminase family protein n=1 Tax=Halopenitus salinus TaxID=1198295 RepID=A0ABD5V2F2_9EURY
MRVLSDSDVESVLDLTELLAVVEEAFERQGRGEVERPERPHFPVGKGLVPPGDPDGAASDEPLGTGLAMPAYIHGADTYATKLVGVHEGNAERGLPTVNATIAVTDAATGQPVAYMAGSRVTNARTGCIGGLAARALAPEGPVTLGLIGAGQQARWQARAIDAATDLERVRVYSPSDSRVACASDLQAEGINAVPVESAAAAVTDATVVVTATTARSSVFDGRDLRDGALVVAIGAYTESMRELDERTMRRADRIFADVPSEAAETGDVPSAFADELIPFSSALSGAAGRETDSEVIVVESVGTAVLDAAAAEHLHEAALSAGVGTEIGL